MKQIPSKTTYLEMHTPPSAELQPPTDVDVQIQRLEQPSVEFYRFLYNSVGAQYYWVDRNLWPDDKLQALLEDPLVEIYLLRVDSQAAGYAELDRRTPGQVELSYFGLFPQFVGRGLGTYFLACTVRQAWAELPQRVWVHTCDLDHPAALPTYLKAGFQIYDEKIVQQIVPDEPSC
jgi:GNAT superfamily N-acetyltransferase